MKNIVTIGITATVTSLATATALALVRKKNEANGVKMMIDIIESNFAGLTKTLDKLGMSIKDDYEYCELHKLYQENLKIKNNAIKLSELKKLNERLLEYDHIRFTQG